MDEVLTEQIFGANCSLDISYTINSSSALPTNLTEISISSLVCVIVYCIVFVIATSGNAIVLSELYKQYKSKHSRITLLLLHLSLADLIVCCTLIPTEVFWRLTIQWRGGSLLCKFTQFLRAFGLYLSSLVLICVSIDRFLAIMFPLNMVKVRAYHRIKILLSLAWFWAIVFSLPQTIFFAVESHPDFPSFKQCVTNDFLNSLGNVKIYSIFSVAVMYFIPLIVIVLTYSAIIIKLIRKSRRQFSQPHCNNVHVSIYRRQSSNFSREFQGNGARLVVQLRSSAEDNLSKAKTRTLLMTVVIVATFVFCWTPYAVMTLWYMVDWKGAANVDPWIQDALFLMAVANSCINPLIYRSFSIKRESKFRAYPRTETTGEAS